MAKKNKGPRISGQPQSQRQLRVGELIRHALIEALSRGVIYDPVIEDSHPTISEVRPSPDLKRATVFVAPLGGGDATELLKVLKQKSGMLRSEVSRRVTLKYTPDLAFVADDSFDRASDLGRLMHSPGVARDLASDEEE